VDIAGLSESKERASAPDRSLTAARVVVVLQIAIIVGNLEDALKQDSLADGEPAIRVLAEVGDGQQLGAGQDRPVEKIGYCMDD
jgi:hypothetical protein